ncbi:DUF1488 domain-containing protein [Vibrio sp. 404]|uniref:DUF1488 domain-containing protein n=1 Tax=Vibrio marinisediminis TaxID=2758441 RepID=A0A7W2FTR9_9VIBR|nr:DUF1488 domain-containing protein [Vibrio marinisediminis]MBA5764118.1 DUF1488 domain-containing protein [Vibrio marinisediminis]
MNQSILFPDIQTWNEELNAVTFPAQQSGALIECVASVSYLSQLSEQAINGAQQALDVFEQNRFEIEEQAEQLIEDEEYNAQGMIELIG